jgi:hypothetical protein
MMQRVLGRLFFAFGCLMTAFGVVWIVAGQSVVLIAPRTEAQRTICFLLYALVMLPTLGPWSRTPWPPVFEVTRPRIVMARIALLIVALIVVSSFAIVAVGRATDAPLLLDIGFVWVIGSLLLLNGVYLVVHWALRPQNIFGGVPTWVLNPFGILLVPLLKKAGVVGDPRSDDEERESTND